MAREVNGVGGSLLRVAEDHVIDLRRLDSGAIQRLLARHHAQVGCGELFEGPAEGAESGPDAGKEHYVRLLALSLHNRAISPQYALYKERTAQGGNISPLTVARRSRARRSIFPPRRFPILLQHR